MKNKADNIILSKSFSFAIRIVKLHRILLDRNKEFILSRQLLRCGTSIGANVREADNAESKKDFIHKMGIAQKETAEVSYWLELMNKTDYLTLPEFDSLQYDAQELLRIISKIILSSKQALLEKAVDKK